MKKLISFSVFLLLICPYLPGQNYKVIKNISYTEHILSDRQKLDIYIPAHSDDIMPCLVWIHGGAWLAGSKDYLPPEIDTLLNYHFVIVCIGYRLSYEAIFPAQINDCKAAIRFIKANGHKYNIDSSRIAVAGSSAGGHLASLTGTSGNIDELENLSQGNPHMSSQVKAVVDFYGPNNFLVMDSLPDVCSNDSPHLHPDSPESKLLGCNITVCPEKVKMANPITYITKDDPPFLIIHGTKDCTVTPLSSALLQEQLEKTGVESKLYWIEGAGHGGKEFITKDVKSTVLDFLTKYLQ